MNFQYHMIACIDHVSQWYKVVFQPEDAFSEFAVKVQLSWSNNVHEECDTLRQIVFGLNTQFIVCILVWQFGWSFI